MRPRTLLAAGLLLLASHALACAPAPWGQGTRAITGSNALGAWAAWYCDDGYTVEQQLYAVRWDALTPELRADLMRLSDAANVAVAIGEMVKRHATLPIEAEELWEVYASDLERIAAASPPQPVWTVATLGAAVDRPAYRYERGVRSRYSRDRAAVGAACDARVRSVEGETVYALVAEGLVAVCKREPS